MGAAKLSVSLLAMTPNAEALIYTAAKQCYSDKDAVNIFEGSVDDLEDDISREDQQKLIRHAISSGHESVVEHVSFSFAVTGISRSLSHQLVRHRIGSYSQQSQRYVDSGHFNYIVPPQIASNPKALDKFINVMIYAGQAYEEIQELLKQGANSDKVDMGKIREDARFVLPNACETKIVFTMNCRSLLHFFELRSCVRAQWEIRAMANTMLKICKKELPIVFESAGALCDRRKFCNENKSCGRAPKLEDIFEKASMYDSLCR